MGKSKSEVLQKVDEHRKKNSKTSRTKNSAFQDHLERPERKILLVHGQPGLGKTTLAHVVAQTAGYQVIEINARYNIKP
jgi:chromosome transmission fidelity protein 18